MAIIIGGPTGITWEAARNKVRGDLWRPGKSLPDDVVDRALHASILDLESEANWLWLQEVNLVLALDDDASTVFLPPVVGTVHSVALRRGGYLDPLTQLTIAPVREAAVGTSGDPTWWALGNDAIWFDCTVPAGSEFELVVTAATPPILEVALETACPTLQRQQQAVIAGAASYVALNFMKNAEEAARQRAAYERIVDRLHDQEAARRGGGVQPDTWGSGYCG